MRLADVSIRRPVFAVMLVGGLSCSASSRCRGSASTSSRASSSRSSPSSRGSTGAAPETVEREVTQVLEESINTIEGIRSLSSQSTDSLSLIYIEFELEYDIRRKVQEVRDQVAAVSGELPQDVEVPVVNRVDPDAAPILAVMLSGPHAIRTLSEFADKHVKTRLERVPGVGSVALAGDRATRDPRLDRPVASRRLRPRRRRRDRRTAARARRAARRTPRDRQRRVGAQDARQADQRRPVRKPRRGRARRAAPST